MEDERPDNGEHEGDEPLTFLEVLDGLMRSKGAREWLGTRSDLWFRERRLRIAEARAKDQRHFTLARWRLVAGAALAVLVVGCLTGLAATGALPKDASLPLFGAIVGAIFARGRADA